MRRLGMLDRMQLITDDPQEAINFEALFKQNLKQGGALVVNLRGRGGIEMRTAVKATLAQLQDLLVEKKIDPVFLFAEEAHLYLEESDWVDVVTRVRHLALHQFYMTNSPTKIPDLVIRQADNLFLFHLDLEEDVRHVAPAGRMDERSLSLVAKSLPPRTFLLVGECTSNYPVILSTIELPVQAAGETRLFFKER